MQRKTKKRIFLGLLALVLIFYVTPTFLCWYGSRLCYNGHDYKDHREYANENFARGIKIIRFTSYFPGFRDRCEMLILVYMNPLTVDYYLGEMFAKEHCIQEMSMKYMDSILIASRADDTAVVEKYRRLEDTWNKKMDKIDQFTLSDHLQDSLCGKWSDITALLRELNEEKFPPMEKCK
ncbi:MAG TPA: hypothetical protein VI112_01725 [Bacteroidia bacterium]|jgi:hypothetical protein